MSGPLAAIARGARPQRDPGGTEFWRIDPAGADDAVIAAALREGHAKAPLSGNSIMNRSTERILTTHTGSLPRPRGPGADDVRQGGRRAGGPGGAASAHPLTRWPRSSQAGRGRHRHRQRRRDEQAELRHLHQGPARRLRRRAAIRWSTRTSATSRSSPSAVFGDPGRSRRKHPACNGPIAVRDREQRPDATSTTCKPRSTGSQRPEAFMTAASPGVISLFFQQRLLPDARGVLYAIAEAMRQEYEAIVDAGFVLQIDCPDLAMGRHIQFAGPERRRVPRKRAALHIEALNHALANIPAGPHAHARVLGQLRRPAPLRRAASTTSSTSCSRRSRARSRSRPPIRATRTNGRCSRTSSCPTARC